MRIDLDDILAGVGARRAHERHQHLIYRLVARRVDDVSIGEEMAGWWLTGGGAGSGKHRPAGRGRDGGDGLAGVVARILRRLDGVGWPRVGAHAGSVSRCQPRPGADWSG